MLESNNDNNINNNIDSKINVKKKKSVLFILVIIYIILAILFTTGSILFYKKTGKNVIDYFLKTEDLNIVGENIYEIEEQTEEIEISGLTDQYAINNIEFKEIKNEIKPDYIYQDELEKEYKNKIEYCQISGLKDKAVQNKINQDIKQKVESMLDEEEINNEEIDYIWISSDVMGNFSNVLSIHVYKTINYKEQPGEEQKYENSWIGLNYRLDTGEELKFEDLFFKTASIKNILSQNLYEDMAFDLGWKYATNSEEYLDPDMDNLDYSELETKILKIIDSYNKGEKVEFYFSSNSINAQIDGVSTGIEMIDFYEYISIFNLVTPKQSLYENGDLKELNYVFAIPYISNCMFFDKITNDIFLSIFSYYDPDYNSEEYQKMKTLVDENIDEITTLIKRNENKQENKNGKGKIYNISYMFDSEEGLYASGEKVEVDLNNFDEEIDKVYTEACRQKAEGEWMLTLYCIEDGYNIRIEKQKDFDFLTLYQKLYTEMTWNGVDGTQLDMYGNVIENSLVTP